jgi:type I restriction enzyme R subunit
MTFLSPDAFLRPYIADMETLTRMYKILKEAYEPGIAIDKCFSRKTAKLVQAHTKTGLIKPALKIYEINESTVKKIEESTAYDTEKVFNLIRSIEKTIKNDVTQKPYLIPIGERAEQITKLFKERQKNSQETLEELKKVIDEINAAKKEQAERDMPVEIFSIFWLFKNEGIDNPEDKANQMRRVLVQYPHWRTSERHEREIKRELYSVLFQAGIHDTHKITTLGRKTMNVLKGGSG